MIVSNSWCVGVCVSEYGGVQCVCCACVCVCVCVCVCEYGSVQL